MPDEQDKENFWRQKQVEFMNSSHDDPSKTIDKMMGWMMQMTMIREMPKMFSGDSQRSPPPPEPKKESILDKYGDTIMLKSIMGDGSKGDRDILLELIRQDKNGKEDPIYTLMREEVRELKTASEAQKKTLYDKIDKLQESAQKNKDEQHEKEISALRDQIDAMAADKYNTPAAAPVEAKRTLDDDLMDMFKQAFKRDFQQTMERKFGVDFEKPKSERSPTAINTIERIFKGVAETATEVARNIGRSQSLNRQNQISGGELVTFPVSKAAMPSHVALAVRRPTRTSPIGQAMEPLSAVPEPQPSAAEEEMQKIPEGDTIYESADGQLLTPDEAQEAIAEGAKITKVKQE